MQLTWFGTNQKRFAHQAQSDWQKFGGTFILNLDNTVYWAKAKYEIQRLLDIIHCIIISFGRASRLSKVITPLRLLPLVIGVKSHARFSTNKKQNQNQKQSQLVRVTFPALGASYM